MNEEMIEFNYSKTKKLESQLNDIANKQWCDFMYDSAIAPWYSVGIGTGSKGVVAGNNKHPGILNYTSGSSANSGYAHRFGTNVILLSGNEKTTFIFKTSSTLTGITRRMGFHDTGDQNAPVDGVYCKILDSVLAGQTVSNSNLSTTGTSYTVTPDTWYRLKIELNADATNATFTLYQDDSNTVLWTDTLSTNIPKTAGRELGHGDVCINSNAVSTVIGYIDYMDIILPNARRVV